MTGEDIPAWLEALPFPALLIGRDERILAANPAANLLFPAAMAGGHLVTAIRQPAILEALEATMADGVRRQARYLGREGGRDTTWRVTLGAVAASGGRAVLLSFEDLTSVEQAEEMRRDFVANVSHELRTPLTALLGFVETLRGAARDDPAARERFLGIMAREAGRMARLVDDLLSLSRVEQEERRRPVETVDLPALIESVVAGLGPRAEATRVQLVPELPGLPVQVPGDAEQLRQVLNNLIENAIKYGGPDRRVEIRLTGPAQEPRLRGAGVRIAVRDHGEGIAGHHIGRLTERFYRVDTHRSREVGGTGLGLAIVKHIVNRHRGRLLIESTPGAGSTFSVLLPTEWRSETAEPRESG